jgi:hypothetical protein
MEVHPYALKMQDQLIQDFERAQPEYVVFVNNDLSWLCRANSQRKIYTWWDGYWTSHYDVIRSQNVITEVADELQNLPGAAEGESKPPQASFLLILKRKPKV